MHPKLLPCLGEVSRRDGGVLTIAQKYTGPCPMHEVVLIAVSAAVSTEIASWITDFQKSLFFIVMMFFSSERRDDHHFLWRKENDAKETFPLLNLPRGEDLIDFGLTPFIKVFLYRSQAYALRASDNFLLASRGSSSLRRLG